MSESISNIPNINYNDLKRFRSKVKYLPNGCWEWKAWINDWGYGIFVVRDNGRKIKAKAHKVAYLWFVDEIKPKRHLHHLCENKACVNPSHLIDVTVKQHMQLSPAWPSRVNSRKTHCPQGHLYDDQNTHIHPDGSRRCRKCDLERHSRHA